VLVINGHNAVHLDLHDNRSAVEHSIEATSQARADVLI
jgi:hypothetical protein